MSNSQKFHVDLHKLRNKPTYHHPPSPPPLLTASLFRRLIVRLTMSRVLPRPFNIMFIYIEPILTLAGAYSAISTPEWYLSSLIPGPTVTGLLHTTETNMAIRLMGVLLILLALISLAVFPVIQSRTDAVGFSIARRLLFVLSGMFFFFLRGVLIVVVDALHIYVVAVHLGEAKFMDVKGWNDLTWGNIGITTGLLLSRLSWFASVGLRRVDDGKKMS